MPDDINRFVISYFDANGDLIEAWGFAKKKSALEIFAADAEFRNGHMVGVSFLELTDTKKNQVLATAGRPSHQGEDFDG